MQTFGAILLAQTPEDRDAAVAAHRAAVAKEPTDQEVITEFLSRCELLDAPEEAPVDAVMVKRYQVLVGGRPARLYSDLRGRRVYFDAPVTEFSKLEHLRRQCERWGIVDYVVWEVARHAPQMTKELAL